MIKVPLITTLANPMRGFFGRTTTFSVPLDTETAVALSELPPITKAGITLSNNADFTFAKSGYVKFTITARWVTDVWIKWWLKNLTTNAIVGESVTAGAAGVASNQPGIFEFIAKVEAGVVYGLRTSSGSTGAYNVATPSPTVTFTNFTGRNIALSINVIETGGQ